MRKTREILRQKWVLGLSHREVAQSLSISAGAVGNTVLRAQSAGLDWPALEGLDDQTLEQRLYGAAETVTEERPAPDCAWVHVERRKAGVTLALLHLEYLERYPNGYRYTQFCEHYRKWVKTRGLSMRQVHLGGEKLFVDYAGKKPHIVDRQTGELVEVELFITALGASSLTYAEASRTQTLPDWISSHVRAFAYLGGVPGAVVPDQLRCAVSAPCRYEPGINRTYEELARHYDTVVLPARPARPRDKAKVEVAVQIAERWIVARLRNQTFFSVDEMNERIWELLEELNDRTMKVYGQSRRQLFEKLDRPALGPLPSEPFVYAEWKGVRANIDYHVEVEHHYYSVHHSLIHETFDARTTPTMVELFHNGGRHTCHARSYERGRYTTKDEHRPKSHREHAEWPPSRLIGWAETVGPQTAALVRVLLEECRHPERGYRSCLGILRLSERYGVGRVEAACGRALTAGARSYKHVKAILDRGLDRLPARTEPPSDGAPVAHENIRGPKYYH